MKVNSHRTHPGEAWEAFIVDAVYPEPQVEGQERLPQLRQAGPGHGPAVLSSRTTASRRSTSFKKRTEFLGFNRRRMSVFEACDFLNTLVDDSDPDIELDQLQHLLQTSEAIRATGQPDWFVLMGLMHDLGKVLCLFGEPQWAVVGDTFPVGCRFSDRIVYPEFFANNPDAAEHRFNTRLGVYGEGCGLRSVTLSWGHDEYLYHRMKSYLPEPALYMIRFHSFYAWHREGEYDYLCDDHDRAMLHWVQTFNPFDLYSNSPEPPDWTALRPYYEQLVANICRRSSIGERVSELGPSIRRRTSWRR